MLIAIFALLLISVVGIALLVSTSADTALAGNYLGALGPLASSVQLAAERDPRALALGK